MKRFPAGFFFFGLLLFAGDPQPPRFALPDVAEPRRYSLDLTIVPGAETFRGVATIDLEFKRRLTFFWLNGRDLTVDAATLDGAPVRVTPAGGDFLGIALPRATGPGPARLEIVYRGRIGDRVTTGVFRKRSGAGWYVFTTFTAIEARRAFPCFDEPRYKTPWQLTLHTPRGTTALSNTHEIAASEEPGEMKKTVFAATAPLPSYLVAFAVGPFDLVDTKGHGAVKMRIITPRGRAAEAQAARDDALPILSEIEKYTGTPYPFDKLDHLALLEGAYGAIENPGLITYQQRILLAKPDEEIYLRRRGMRSTMSHELAHQWFGDLVTMADWDDVWLSEGFATWMSLKIMDRLEPETRRRVAAVDARNRIMTLDSTPAARSVRVPMASRTQMRGVYSPFIYQKAAAVLVMLENWLGEEAFQQGIRRYLDEHRFANATTAAFVDAIRASGSRDIGPELRSFFDQPGVPVITAETRCDVEPARIVLRQDRFQPLGIPVEPLSWRLPVCVKADGLAPRCLAMNAPETEIPVAACPAWVFPNAGGTGYYRSLLGPDLLAALSLHGDQLTAAERLTLAQDISALVRNGRLPAAEALALLPWMARDSEPLVAIAASDLAAVLALIVPPPLKAKYEKFVRSTFGAAPLPKVKEQDLLRSAQQASVVEFLSR